MHKRAVSGRKLNRRSITKDRLRRPRNLLLALVLAACSHGLSPVDEDSTGLHGSVSLQGEWPDDTAVVAVALLQEKPTTSDISLLVRFTEPDSFGVSSFDYLWTLEPGVYGYLAIAWMREGDNLFDLMSWVELGFYPDPDAPGEPGEIVVVPGINRCIDLEGDFVNVPPPVGEPDPRSGLVSLPPDKRSGGGR